MDTRYRSVSSHATGAWVTLSQIAGGDTLVLGGSIGARLVPSTLDLHRVLP